MSLPRAAWQRPRITPDWGKWRSGQGPARREGRPKGLARKAAQWPAPFAIPGPSRCEPSVLPQVADMAIGKNKRMGKKKTGKKKP